jgi:hypothetical protein
LATQQNNSMNTHPSHKAQYPAFQFTTSPNSPGLSTDEKYIAMRTTRIGYLNTHHRVWGQCPCGNRRLGRRFPQAFKTASPSSAAIVVHLRRGGNCGGARQLAKRQQGDSTRRRSAQQVFEGRAKTRQDRRRDRSRQQKCRAIPHGAGSPSGSGRGQLGQGLQSPSSRALSSCPQARPRKQGCYCSTCQDENREV